jgi:hypothetical protein
LPRFQLRNWLRGHTYLPYQPNQPVGYSSRPTSVLISRIPGFRGPASRFLMTTSGREPCPSLDQGAAGPASCLRSSPYDRLASTR